MRHRALLREERFFRLLLDRDSGEVVFNPSEEVVDAMNPHKVFHDTERFGVPIAFPIVAFLELTEACNLRCRHCFNSSGKRAANELSTSELVAILQEMGDNGLFLLKISGGEPFCRFDLLEILGYINALEIPFMVYTNGTQLSSNHVDALSTMASLKCVRVSVDGVRETNDKIRGKGTFDLALEAVRCLEGAGIPTEINLTLTKVNYTEIKQLCDQLDDIDIRALVNLGFAKKSGRAIAGGEALIFNASELSVASGVALGEIRRNGRVKQLDMLPEFYYDIYGESFGCPAGRVSVSIASNGDVYPCGLFKDIKPFRFGNLREQNLKSIWNGQNSALFRELELNDRCANCFLFGDGCTGGCRGNAFKMTGLLSGDDDNCGTYCYFTRQMRGIWEIG